MLAREMLCHFIFECRQVVLQTLHCIVDLSSVRAVVMTMKVESRMFTCIMQIENVQRV